MEAVPFRAAGKVVCNSDTSIFYLRHQRLHDDSEYPIHRMKPLAWPFWVSDSNPTGRIPNRNHRETGLILHFRIYPIGRHVGICSLLWEFTCQYPQTSSCCLFFVSWLGHPPPASAEGTSHFSPRLNDRERVDSFGKVRLAFIDVLLW